MCYIYIYEWTDASTSYLNLLNDIWSAQLSGSLPHVNTYTDICNISSAYKTIKAR